MKPKYVNEFIDIQKLAEEVEGAPKAAIFSLTYFYSKRVSYPSPPPPCHWICYWRHTHSLCCTRFFLYRLTYLQTEH